MKKLIYTFFTFSALALAFGCDGPEGPPGPQGPRGPQGYPGEEGLVIEYEDVDFRAADDFGVVLNFLGYEALPSDAVLVYAWWDEVETNNGTADVWRPLPITSFVPEGTLVYNYNHTTFDVEVFLDGNFNLYEAPLGPDELDDWIIRIVIVPAQYMETGRMKSVDFSNYEEVVEHFDLPRLPSPEVEKRYERPGVGKE